MVWKATPGSIRTSRLQSAKHAYAPRHSTMISSFYVQLTLTGLAIISGRELLRWATCRARKPPIGPGWPRQAKPFTVLFVPTLSSVLVAWPAVLDEGVQLN